MTMKYETKSLHKTIFSLISYINRGYDIKRIARVGTCMLLTGCYRGNKEIIKSKNRIIAYQKKDGGWVDNEETIWSIAFLKKQGKERSHICKLGVRWLKKQKHCEGGWGRTFRDLPRIPTTGLLLHLLPEISDDKTLSWITKEWEKDLNSDTRLTYKGAFFLMGLSAKKISASENHLIEKTYEYLYEEQNEDGGFSPWKSHPIGSDPWSTGIVLLGLLSYPERVKRTVVKNTVTWLQNNKLKNGLWPCHYIEEGSSYAYWGLVEALKYLKKEKE